MNYLIDKNDRTPAYLQLYRCLVKDITEGVYLYGTRLPSKRVMAAETGVSIITAEHAIALLCDEGYCEARERSGCFVIYREADFAIAKACGGIDGNPVSRGVHSKTEFPFSVLSRAMRKVLLDYGESILVKSPNHGSMELRNAISAYLARSRGIQVHPGRIIVGSGAEYLYGLIGQLLGTGRIYAIEDPSYEKIRRVYETLGIQCELLPLGENGITSRALAGAKATVLHVTPFNSYPSGITADISKKREYLRWIKERGGCIVEDNYDSELTVSAKPEDSLFSMADGANVIYINTFSHTIAPSMRIGYMLLPEALSDEFNRRLGFYSCTVPLFEQYVLAELINSGDYERHINRVRRQRRREEGKK